MKTYLPIVIFAICILIAVILVVAMPSLWPAALAVALSGGALAMALRPNPASDLGYLVDDMTVLQEQNTELRGMVEKNNVMIDELADVVEQMASLSADGGNVTRAQIDKMRGELTEIRNDLPQSEQSDEWALRLSALETQTAELASGRTSSLGLTEAAVVTSANRALESRTGNLEARLGKLEARVSDADRLQDQSPRQPEKDVKAPPAKVSSEATAANNMSSAPASALVASAPDNGPSSSLVVQGSENASAGKSGAVAPDAQPKSDPVDPAPSPKKAIPTLAPIFRPDLGPPVSFILRPAKSSDPESVHSLLRHAIQITKEMEEEGREVLLFVWLDASILSVPSVRDDILAAIRTEPALQRRLTMLTGQSDFDASAQKTLAAIAEEGCKFGLDGVFDWSLNLAALARDGLSYILVDGPAMATAAKEEGGEARRLSQALGKHNIQLIGGDVATKNDIDSVHSLEPSLMTGEGLGEAQVLEVKA